MKLDSITLNLKKNVLQYLIGFSLYLLAYGSFKPIKLILGLTSFLIAYSGIYPYNDLMDLENDKRDEFKKHYKALARGDMSQQTAITLAYGLPIIGLFIASFVSQWYMILLIFLLLQNFLHSSPKTTKFFKKKKRVMFINMYLMQAIKFTLGWFTFTTDLTRLPVWIINTLALAYVWSYYVYKKGLKKITKALKSDLKTAILLSVSTLTSYFFAIFLYPYKLVLILLPLICLLFFTQFKHKSLLTKTLKLSNMTVIVFGLIVVMLLMLNVPAIANLNKDTSQAFDELIENDTFICTLNETVATSPIKNLNELEGLINIKEKELSIKT